MPEICRFYGIVIKMYYGDHLPPHFYAEYGEYKALININTLSVFEGYLPGRALGLIVEWAQIHHDELLDLWRKASNNEKLFKVDPLV